MPRIKRWFPVTQDLHVDEEMWELRETHGDRAGFVWLEICNIADRNGGKVGRDGDQLRAVLSSRCRTTRVKVSSVLTFALERGWLFGCRSETSTKDKPAYNLWTANHAKYHRHEKPKNPVRDSIPTPPRPDQDLTETKTLTEEEAPPVDKSKNEEEGVSELAAMVEHIHRKDPPRFAKLIVWTRTQLKEGWKAPQLIKALVKFNLRDTQEPVQDWWPYLTKACQAIRTQELQGEAAAHVVRDPSSMGGILEYLKKGEA